jgi:hypothetical protein
VVVADVVTVVVVIGGHGPIVSPCLKCAGTAGAATVMVWNGFFFE